MSDKRLIYAAKFEFDRARLSEFVVVSETEKTYVLADRRNIIDSIYVGARVNKYSYEWFDTEVAALEWVAEQYREHARKLHIRANQADAAVPIVEDMLRLAKERAK